MLQKGDSDHILTVERVARSVAETERQHLARGRVERTFTTALYRNLHAEFAPSGLEVDAFYNKHLHAAKKLNGKIIELDIAIHRQGSDLDNIVAIELETTNSPKRDDVWKLQHLTTPMDGYGYRLGLYLVVGIESRAGEIIAMEWYKDGAILVSRMGL